MDDRTYDAAVASIYRAATGGAPWGDALQSIATGLDAWGAQLVGVNKTNGALLFSHDGGIASPTSALDYIRTYHHCNPRVPPTLALAPDAWFHDHEHFDEQFVARSPFYQDFLIPHGGHFASGTKIFEDAERLVIFGAMRSNEQQPFDTDERITLDRLKGQLCQAVTMQNRLGLERTQLSVGATLLNQFERPMMLVSAERSILFSNNSAQRALARGEYLVERAGALHCCDKYSDQALATALYELRLVDGLLHSGPPPDRRFVRTTSRTDGAAVGVYLSAMRPERTMYSFGNSPQALVFVHDSRHEPDLDPMIVAETFGLTPAEADVAVLLASGLTVDRIATRRSVSVATVRAQVAAVLAKTRVSRQSDLIRMLTAMPSLADQPPTKLGAD